MRKALNPKAPALKELPRALKEPARKLSRKERATIGDKSTEVDPAYTVAWFDASLNADHWLAMEDVSPETAALLLAGFDPMETDVETAKRSAVEAIGDPNVHANEVFAADDFKRLLDRFCDVAKVEPGNRSLEAWHDLAAKQKVKVHQWLAAYGAAEEAIRLAEHASKTKVRAVDRNLLASRSQLLDAFYPLLNEAWFRDLGDREWLHLAQREKGRPGRGHREPLFCPYEVMQGLRLKARGKERLSEPGGWQRLKDHFPAAHAFHAPKRRIGG